MNNKSASFAGFYPCLPVSAGRDAMALSSLLLFGLTGGCRVR
ncbi:hypothetical protein ACQ3G6_11880 [Allorhizobium undicola]